MYLPNDIIKFNNTSRITYTVLEKTAAGEFIVTPVKGNQKKKLLITPSETKLILRSLNRYAKIETNLKKAHE